MRRRLCVFYVNLGDSPVGPAADVNVVIDDSGSMAGDNITEVRKAFRQFVDAAPENVHIGLSSFGTDVTVYSRPSGFREFLLDQAERFRGKSGETNLYDAVGDACSRFDGDAGRMRYVLALTDGGDTGSRRFNLDGSAGRTDVIAQAVSSGVRIFAVGFGGAHEDALCRLSRGTDGEYFIEKDAKGVVAALQAALQLIIKDRDEVRPRPELHRLLQRTPLVAEEAGVWLREQSLDEWSEDRFWYDKTHVRWPRAERRSVSQYRSLFDEIANSQGLKERVREQLLEQDNQSADVGRDSDFVVVGRLEDPAFHVFSIEVQRMLRAIRDDAPHMLTGLRRVFHVALVPEVGRLPAAVRSSCYEWLASVSSMASVLGPQAVITCGGTNQHRAENRTGLRNIPDQEVRAGVANVIRSMGLAENRLAALRKFDDGGLTIAWGAAALGVDQQRAAGVFADRLLPAGIREIVDGRWEPAIVKEAVVSSVKAMGTSVQEVERSLLAPLLPTDPEKVLSSIRFAVADVWPAPKSMAESVYVSMLPRLVDERASEYLMKIIDAVSATITRRSGELIELVLDHVRTMTDRHIARPGSGRIASADAYLEGVVDHLRVARREMELLDVQSVVGVDSIGIFPSDAPADAEATPDAEPDPDAAKAELERLARQWPEPSGLLLRATLLGVGAGAVVHALWPPIVVLLGYGPSPWLRPFVAGAVGFSAPALAVLHLWLERRRLQRALRDLLDALVLQAKRAAAGLFKRQALALYDRLLAAIGESADELAQWVPPEVRDETSVPERQKLRALADLLRRVAERAAVRGKAHAPFCDRFVWEVGSRISDLASPERNVPVGRSDWGRNVVVPWDDVWPNVGWEHWREICRRRLCDTEDAFLAYHRERLEFPGRLHRLVAECIASSVADQASVPKWFPVSDHEDRSQLLEVLNRTAFPLVLLGETPKPENVARQWVIQGDAHSLIGGALQVGAGGRSLPDDWEHCESIGDSSELLLIRSFWVRPSDCVDWAMCGEAWNAQPEEQRHAFVTAMGVDSSAVRDPITGLPWASAEATDPADDSGSVL